MPRPLVVLLALAAGDLVGAAGGRTLVPVASSNPHDRALGAAMAGAVVTGPPGVVLGGGAGLWRGPGRRGRAVRGDGARDAQGGGA